MDRDSVIVLLGEVPRGTVPLPGAACRGRSELFDHQRDGEAPEERDYRLNAALRRYPCGHLIIRSQVLRCKVGGC